MPIVIDNGHFLQLLILLNCLYFHITFTSHHIIKAKRKSSLPEHLPQIKKLVDAPESARPCPKQGAKTAIGSDTLKALIYEPPKLYMQLTEFLKYACPCCKEHAVVTAERPTGLVEGNKQLMREVAIGRKNWLFVGNVELGERVARLMSLVSSAKRHQLAVWMYLKDVLQRVLKGEADYSKLVPDVWKQEHPDAIRGLPRSRSPLQSRPQATGSSPSHPCRQGKSRANPAIANIAVTCLTWTLANHRSKLSTGQSRKSFKRGQSAHRVCDR